MAIELIDLTLFANATPEERRSLLDKLLHSCATQGFCKVNGHGISGERIAQLFSWAEEFFDLPNEVKLTASRSRKGPYRGYCAVGQEQIAAISGFEKGGNDVHCKKDIKESFDVGPEHDTRYPTPWPTGPRCTEFKNFMQSFYAECVTIHTHVLILVEEALALERGSLSTLCTAGNGEVRLTHYPATPLSALTSGSTYRIAEHTDIGVLTLLFQDTVGGLEIESREQPGTFESVDSANPNEMILNIGDTLQRWTGNTLRSTNHRVLYPKALDVGDEGLIVPPRYSVGFFGKANASALMAPLPQYMSAALDGTVFAGEGKTAQDYYNLIHEGTVLE